MNLCPLLIIANQSFNPHRKTLKKEMHCKGKDCSWYDSVGEKCKLADSICKKEYVLKSFNFI
ncbi:hypothetical protein [Halanaerobacter jeridensis]|uniref:Uncharacterized protein n=1 Tax=Halanaerobacter jeridensis TaxID=706427 RepID=A0A939BLY2_9FIRM|nr:hypothetical protein [Halanaerobacter jeridensis]MBM7555200.1 hypothetical protein [Halanaerobacter jeridensis]